MVRKIAFAGLRHGHINALFQAAQESPELEITAICEEDSGVGCPSDRRRTDYG